MRPDLSMTQEDGRHVRSLLLRLDRGLYPSSQPDTKPSVSQCRAKEVIYTYHLVDPLEIASPAFFTTIFSLWMSSLFHHPFEATHFESLSVLSVDRVVLLKVDYCGCRTFRRRNT